jgi:hypothetical protein
MGLSENAKNRMVNSKTGVGFGMVLVGLIAAGSVAKSKRSGASGVGVTGKKKVKE